MHIIEDQYERLILRADLQPSRQGITQSKIGAVVHRGLGVHGLRWEEPPDFWSDAREARQVIMQARAELGSIRRRHLMCGGAEDLSEVVEGPGRLRVTAGGKNSGVSSCGPGSELPNETTLTHSRFPGHANQLQAVAAASPCLNEEA